MSNTTHTNAHHRPPWRVVVLTALVLLAHWALLRAAPLSLAAHASSGASNSWTFVTRTLTPAQPTGAAREPTQQAPTAPAPKPRTPQATPAMTRTAEHAITVNDTVAPDKYYDDATESIASGVSVDIPNPESPTLLAAATPPEKALLAAPTVAPGGATPHPAAHEVRKFAIPASARLKYEIKGEVKGFPYHVNGELLWVQDGTTYDARMEISHFLLGSRVQTSTGLLTAHGLEPTRFGDKVRSEVAAHFNREKHKVTFSANTPDVALLSGAQDQLSVLVQLASMLGAEPDRFPKATTLPFQAVGPRSAESWVFTVGDSEKLVLPGGELHAVRLWRDPLGEFDPRVEIWLAPGVGYLPVRIRLTQANGDVVDQQWRETQKP